MELGLLKKKKAPPVNLVIVSGSCCIPGMAPLDEKAFQIAEQAISETGVPARIRIIPANKAFFGGVPPKVMAQLLENYNKTKQVGLPAILFNGKLISCGIPQLNEIKSVLLETTGEKTKGDNAND